MAAVLSLVLISQAMLQTYKERSLAFYAVSPGTLRDREFYSQSQESRVSGVCVSLLCSTPGSLVGGKEPAGWDHDVSDSFVPQPPVL